MREKFYAELSRRLREEGIESSYAGTQNLRVSLHGQPVLRVTPSSEIFILPAGSQNEEVNDLYHRVGETADEVYEYVEAVQGAPLLHASDLKEEFRLLADFGCAVLAGRERENDRGYQFVTWVWDFDRRGVSHGHYYEGNYHAAKEDFAVRSGLISRAQLFSSEQLTELYRTTDFFLEEGPEPEEKQMKALQEARTKIEYSLKRRTEEISALIQRAVDQSGAPGIRGEVEKRAIAGAWLDLAIACAKVSVKQDADERKLMHTVEATPSEQEQSMQAG